MYIYGHNRAGLLLRSLQKFIIVAVTNSTYPPDSWMNRGGRCTTLPRGRGRTILTPLHSEAASFDILFGYDMLCDNMAANSSSSSSPSKGGWQTQTTQVIRLTWHWLHRSEHCRWSNRNEGFSLATIFDHPHILHSFRSQDRCAVIGISSLQDLASFSPSPASTILRKVRVHTAAQLA